jgi:hypothetical protein
VHVSNYGTSDIKGATVSWRVLGTSASGANTTVCQGSSEATPALPQGPEIIKVATIRCKLPDLGTFARSPQPPLTLTLEVELRGGGALIGSNSWRSRVYAAYEDGPSPKGVSIYTKPDWCDSLPYNDLKCGGIPAAGTAVPPGSVFVVDSLDAAAMDFAAAGSTVIVLHTASSASNGGKMGFQTQPAKFKTAWWLGVCRCHNSVPLHNQIFRC